MKKALSLILCSVILLTSSSLSLATSNSMIIEDRNVTPMNNRYYNKVEKGPREFERIRYYTESEARNQDHAVTVAAAALALGGPLGAIDAFVWLVGNAIYDTRVAGKVITYKTVETHYRVDRLTGDKTVTATYWILETEVYAGNNLHRTLTDKFRLKY